MVKVNGNGAIMYSSCKANFEGHLRGFVSKPSPPQSLKTDGLLEIFFCKKQFQRVHFFADADDGRAGNSNREQIRKTTSTRIHPRNRFASGVLSRIPEQSRPCVPSQEPNHQSVSRHQIQSSLRRQRQRGQQEQFRQRSGSTEEAKFDRKRGRRK